MIEITCMAADTVDGPAEPSRAARPTAAVTVDDVSFSYPDGAKALGGISLEVGAGEAVSIVGPSGCGKSTLLAVMAGLVAPSDGVVTWAPQPAQDVGLRRLFTLVFQRDTLLPWLTIEKNIGFGLNYLKISREESRSRVNRLLDLAGLADVRSSYPYQLSGGMRRRVAFLASVAPLPRVLLLDEPFAALDEPTRLDIQREVRRIAAEFGISLVLVTHDLGEAISLASRVHVLTSGPATVIGTHEVPFGPDRDPVKLRNEQRYHDLYRAIWQDLSTQIEASNRKRRRATSSSASSVTEGPAPR